MIMCVDFRVRRLFVPGDQICRCEIFKLGRAMIENGTY